MLRAALLVCDILLKSPCSQEAATFKGASKLEDIIRDARDIGADFEAYCFSVLRG